MRAKIEIASATEADWRNVAACMAAEHAGYYAREQAIAGQCAATQAFVDAYNANARAGGVTNPHYLRGASAHRVDALGEIPAHAWGQCADIPDMPAGMTFSASEHTAVWRTSGGNVLSVRWMDGSLIVDVDGRRHGIPWRFMDVVARWQTRARVLAQESESPRVPWETAAGESVVGEPSVDDAAAALNALDPTSLLATSLQMREEAGSSVYDHCLTGRQYKYKGGK